MSDETDLPPAPDPEREFIDAIESGESWGDLVVMGPDGRPCPPEPQALTAEDLEPSDGPRVPLDD